MSADHLPECKPRIRYEVFSSNGYRCETCDALRQAEQRARAIYEVPAGVWDEESFAAGLTAARDALYALPVVLVDIRKDPFDQQQIRQAVLYDDALAAIDALRGDTDDR